MSKSHKKKGALTKIGNVLIPYQGVIKNTFTWRDVDRKLYEDNWSKEIKIFGMVISKQTTTTKHDFKDPDWLKDKERSNKGMGFAKDTQ